MNRLLIILMVFLQVSFVAAAERIQNYASPRTVFDIVVDGKILWLGTSGGLYHYDLSTGVQYAKVSDASFPDPSVKAVAIDGQGRVWAGSEAGYLLRIDKNGTEYLNTAYVSAKWKVNDLLCYGHYLIVASDKGVSLFDTRKNIVVKNASRIGTFTSSDVNVLKIFKNRLYIGCGLGLAVLKGDVDNIDEVNFYDPSNWQVDSTIDFSVKTILTDKGKVEAFGGPAIYFNTILATADSNHITVHVKDEPYKLYVKSYITYFGNYNTEGVWVGTENDHFYFWDKNGLSNMPITGPTFTGVNRVHVDRTGSVWVVPFGGEEKDMDLNVSPWWLGINRFNGYTWENYAPRKIPEMGHMGGYPEAFGILEARDGSMWFGFSAGSIKRYVPSEKKWFHYCNYGKEFGNGAFLKTQGQCPTIDWGKCDAIAQDSAGYIWMSSWNNFYGSLICYKPDNDTSDSLGSSIDSLSGAYKRFPPNGTSSSTVEIMAIAADKSKNIIYGTKSALTVIRYDKDPFKNGINTIKTFPNLAEVKQIKVQADGTSLVLTSGGVHQFDPVDNSLTLLEEFDKDITSLSFESDSIYWYGTLTSGLVRYEVGRQEKQYYNMASGLISDKINDVYVDKIYGNVWVASDLGISQLVLGYNYTAPNKGAELVYPNPFSRRRHTEIYFQNLPSNGELRIYTLDGTLLAKPKLMREGENGAYYSWKPSSSHAPGTYFYSFVSPEIKSTGKLLFVP